MAAGKQDMFALAVAGKELEGFFSELVHFPRSVRGAQLAHDFGIWPCSLVARVDKVSQLMPTIEAAHKGSQGVAMRSNLACLSKSLREFVHIRIGADHNTALIEILVQLRKVVFDFLSQKTSCIGATSGTCTNKLLIELIDLLTQSRSHGITAILTI